MGRNLWLIWKFFRKSTQVTMVFKIQTVTKLSLWFMEFSYGTDLSIPGRSWFLQPLSTRRLCPVAGSATVRCRNQLDNDFDKDDDTGLVTAEVTHAFKTPAACQKAIPTPHQWLAIKANGDDKFDLLLVIDRVERRLNSTALAKLPLHPFNARPPHRHQDFRATEAMTPSTRTVTRTHGNLSGPRRAST